MPVNPHFPRFACMRNDIFISLKTNTHTKKLNDEMETKINLLNGSENKAQ